MGEGMKNRPRSGRPKKLTIAQISSIPFAARMKPFTTPREIRAGFNLPVCNRTVRKTLNEYNYFAHKARKIHIATPAQQRERVAWARKYEDWEERNWAQVLFIDECHIFLESHATQWVQHGRNQTFNHTFMLRKKSHSPKIHVWACVAASGVGDIVVFQNMNDSDNYIRMLDQHLVSSADRLFRANSEWLLLGLCGRKIG